MSAAYLLINLVSLKCVRAVFTSYFCAIKKVKVLMLIVIYEIFIPSLTGRKKIFMC